MPRQITLYSKPDCHLCHEVRDMLLRLHAQYPLTLREVDIRTDPLLWDRYRYAIPVLVFESGLELEAPIRESEVRAVLRDSSTG